MKKSTGYNKSRVVRDTLKVRQFDPRWCAPSLMDRNPLVWMIEVDGIAVNARWLPREIQEIAYRMGLIPYIPEKTERKASVGLWKYIASDDDELDGLRIGERSSGNKRRSLKILHSFPTLRIIIGLVALWIGFYHSPWVHEEMSKAGPRLTYRGKKEGNPTCSDIRFGCSGSLIFLHKRGLPSRDLDVHSCSV